MTEKFECAYDKIVDLVSLVPNPKNPNNHPQKQIDLLSKIIQYQGQRSPIVVSNRSGFITKGHGRRLALLRSGWTKAAVDYQDYESEAQEYADMIADNKIAELAEHDDAKMMLDLKTIPDLNLEMLGIPDLTLIEDKEFECDPDEIPEVIEPKAKLGQIYQLGQHRLMCGDSTDEATVSKLMNGEKADLIHTDPPYNVDYSNQDRPKAGKKDLGRIENDKMSDTDFKDFLTKAFLRCYEFSKENSSIYIWYASKESINFMQSVKDSNWELNQQIIWKKPMLLGRGKYQWAHEPCILGIKGSPYFTDDRTKTTVWDFGGYDKSKNVHPTQKPIVVCEESIKNSSKTNQSVLDLFGGSGSTLIACEKTNRKCFMMELDPHYVDVIIARWEKITGKKAELIQDNG